MESNEVNQVTTIDLPENAITTLTVEEINDKEKYNLSTMAVDDVFNFLKLVN